MDTAAEIQDVTDSTTHGTPPATSPTIEISKSPKRPRPWSTEGIQAMLSPSPTFDESNTSKDDIHVPPNHPVTPKRPNYPPRGLSLQMPPRDISSTSTANLIKRVPLSPKLDPSNSFATSPGSALPRRSRGMDFARACTNLHHSTLAEQSSPDSSPVVGGRRGISIPSGKSIYNTTNTSTVPDSPGILPGSLCSNGASTEKGVISSSLGSTSMMEYVSDSSSSEEDEMMGHDEEMDTIHMTPQIWKSGNGSTSLFGPAIPSSPGVDNFSPFSPAAAKLMSFQRARTRQYRNRKGSSGASSHSALPPSGPASPAPLLRSIESNMTGDLFEDPTKKEIKSRRESLSLGTCDLDLSDGDQSEGSKSRISPQDDAAVPIPATPSDERRTVIRRAVTRRGNLLVCRHPGGSRKISTDYQQPKSKPFARIRAMLQEESAPVDTEVKREAEVIRQARESDAYGDLIPAPSQPTTSASSPSIQPATAAPVEGLEDIPEDVTMDSDISASRRSSSSTFTQQAIRNSVGLGFWHNFDERIRTPPPMFPRENSSAMSDDVTMDIAQSSIMSGTPQQNTNRVPSRSQSRSSTPQLPPNPSDNLRKGNKRMRDDDLDPSFFKRRAVSPGMSLQNSPILPQSPLQRDGGWWWMQSKYGRETPASQTVGDRISSGGSASSGSGAPPPSMKRVGLQGMSDTNDGLMNMSIE
ncbi:MAG: hypothetical protein LQ338_006020 [Usnochroma carphineum]|nr:MAG: hypothetical protein LQ338_006020 [Usnochroma carphineum]